jgi:hypothetical protein
MGDDAEEPVFESFSLMCNDALERIKGQEETFEAAMLANTTLKRMPTNASGVAKAKPLWQKCDDGEEEEQEEEAAAEVVSDVAFSLMCDEARELVEAREEAAEAALAAAEAEIEACKDVLDKKSEEEEKEEEEEGEEEQEEEEEKNDEQGVPNKIAAGCVAVPRPSTARVVRVAPRSSPQPAAAVSP